ncbi:MAG: tetratricopeptide repeat protein, partial [Flavobacteriaceae bacterium]
VHLQEDELIIAGNYFREAADMYEELDPEMSRTGLSFVLGNQGMIFARLGNHTKAEENLTRAIQLLEEDGNYDPIAEYQITLAEVYLNEVEFNKAHDLAEEGLEHAHRLGKKELISRASRVLAELDFQSEKYKEAFEHQAMYMQYKDSMDVETVDMSRYERERAQLIADRAEANLELESQKRKQERAALWATGVTALLFIIVAVGSFGRYRYMRKTNKIISAERDRSEELLLNILPKETAQELKDNGHVLAKRFESVTVLFTDFKGFTAHAESLDPEKLVESIDLYFSNFDTIMEKYGLEKIKTVGDAYMCASGLPFPSEDHAHRMAEAALELIEFVEEAKTKAPDDLIHFDIRVGINSGPVVAGVVGTKKFAYDIWGDTVNIASRMESASEAGRINIAEETYQLLKDDYECEYRGKIDVKNRGKLNMYFMLGRKAQSKTA